MKCTACGARGPWVSDGMYRRCACGAMYKRRRGHRREFQMALWCALVAVAFTLMAMLLAYWTNTDTR